MDRVPAIQLERLAIGYGGKALFGDFSMEIPEGSFNVIVGSNGSGKSTLLYTVSGDLRAVGGTVKVAGSEVAKMSPRQRSRVLSLVYTERFAGGGLTVTEVVSMGRYPYTGLLGILTDADKEIVHRALCEVGIVHKKDSTMATLSDGERQKVMIARAIAQCTPVLILDEPTNFLDAASRIEVMDLIGRLTHEKNITTVLSTHDLAPALPYADNIITILPSDKCPVVLNRAGSAESIARLNAIYRSRGIGFDPESNDFRML